MMDKMNVSFMLQSILSTILLIPLGLVVGALAERLATRKVYVVSNSIWNTVVKLFVASTVWTRFISINTVEDLHCTLPSSSFLILYSNEEKLNLYEMCSVQQSVLILITLIIKCLFLYISTKLGASLQPVGLTGGIACGKSTVSKLLRKTSQSNMKDAFAIIDVDEIAHDILIPGKMTKEDSAYDAVVSAFQNDDIFEESKDNQDQMKFPAIDRRKLGDIIFPDREKRRKLNSITHPLISKVMMKQTIGENFFPSSDDTSTVAVDIPLLFEVGAKMKALFAVKVVVACTSEVQLERLRTRNPDLTEAQCQKRIESQIPVYKKVEMADIVIWNNGSMDDLIKEVENAREEILSRKHGFLRISLPMLLTIPGIIKTLSCIYEIITAK